MDLREALETLYTRLNRRCLVHPDPLEFLYSYRRCEDREIAGLVASGLAYGRVVSILSGVRRVLDLLGPAPATMLRDTSEGELVKLFHGFRYRFTTGEEMARLLHGVSGLQSVYGSVGELFAGLSLGSGHAEACDSLVIALLDSAGLQSTTLLSRPAGGSACKRLSLFLRWMVRGDEVDPGGWEGVSPARLMVPLDVHMHRAGKLLGFTERKAADWRTVEEVTRGFRTIAPEDPVKYDFALTRFGIRADMDFSQLSRELSRCVPCPPGEVDRGGGIS